MNNKIIDLFCGCGGMSIGFEEAGFEPVVAIDLWEDAIKTYNLNRENPIAICMNIELLTKEYLESLMKENNIVGVIGGPPCQGYSTVGTRDINDPRNHLYLEYFRVVQTVQPEFFVIENVKGLVTLNGGMFKKDIEERFSKLGYRISYSIINASDYGVPQNRQRVFFVGMKNHNFIFPEKFNFKVSSFEALSDLPEVIPGISEYKYDSDAQNDYQRYMRSSSKGVLNHEPTIHSDQTINVINQIPDGGKISDLPDEYWHIRKYNKAFQRMNSKLPSNTIDTGHRNYFHYMYNRIPTARESARLQSFRDDFIFSGSKTSQYKQIGNAVPPLLSKVIAQKIMEYLKLGGKNDK